MGGEGRLWGGMGTANGGRSEPPTKSKPTNGAKSRLAKPLEPPLRRRGGAGTGLKGDHPTGVRCEPRGGVGKLPQAEPANEGGRRGLRPPLEPPLVEPQPMGLAAGEQGSRGAGERRTGLPRPGSGR